MGARGEKAAVDLRTATWEHQNGHRHILEYLIESKFDKYDEVVLSLRPRASWTPRAFSSR